MEYVCDAPGGRTWFRIETEAEAASESDVMRHAVEKFFRKEQEKAIQTFQPMSKVFFEQEIGLKAHIQREMPLFLTRDSYTARIPITSRWPRSAGSAVKHSAAPASPRVYLGGVVWRL